MPVIIISLGGISVRNSFLGGIVIICHRPNYYFCGDD